ncbi:hypothetical protein CBR_g21948 [Chara braunii]|uniref:Response regulatory domain-containing protein n=1 Tax=Chara braunii TaxID=69332 RepID=A0A388L1M9_CHABU|nr:hypothetical protein CBR_g21948 [Chara braunii]|eukprot:GBG76199.1 hypothetical protein CBR_g21948 [Chara braunii]
MAAAPESDTCVIGDARMRAISPIQLPIEKLELLRRLNDRSKTGNFRRICNFAFQDGDSVVRTPGTTSLLCRNWLPHLLRMVGCCQVRALCLLMNCVSGATTSQRQTCNVDAIRNREGDGEDAAGIRISDETPVRDNSYLRGSMELGPNGVTGVPAPSRQVIGTGSHRFDFGGVSRFGQCGSGFTEGRMRRWEKRKEQSLHIRMNDDGAEAQGIVDVTGVTSLPRQHSGACAYGSGLSRGISNLGGCGSRFAGGSIPSLEKIEEQSSRSRKGKRAVAQSSSSSVQQDHSALSPCHLPGGRPAAVTTGSDLQQAICDDAVCLGRGVHCKARVNRVFTPQAVQPDQSSNPVSFTGAPGTRGHMAEDGSWPETKWQRLHGGAPDTVDRDTGDQPAEISIVDLQHSPATLTGQAQRPIATNIVDSLRSASCDCLLVARGVRDNHTPPSECLSPMERVADVEREPGCHTVPGVALCESVIVPRPKLQAVPSAAPFGARHGVDYWNPEQISGGNAGGGDCRDGSIPCSGHTTADHDMAQQPQHCRQPGIVQHSERQYGTTLQQQQQWQCCCSPAYQPQRSHRQQGLVIHEQGRMTKQEHVGIRKEEQMQHGLQERQRQKQLQEELHQARQHHLDHLLHKAQLPSQPEFITRDREESNEQLWQREMQAQQQDEFHKSHLEHPLFEQQGLGEGDNPSCALSAPQVSLRAGPSNRRAKTKDWPRILLAEDNAINVTISIAILEGMGLTASAVSNGVEVLQALRMDTYHLVFMDVCMPVMDGFEATSMIRKLEKSGMRSGPRGVPGIVPSTAMKGIRMDEGYTKSGGVLQSGKIPIIAMITNVAPDNVAKCFAYGMDACIPKPMTASKFREFIRQFCRGVNLLANLHC